MNYSVYYYLNGKWREYSWSAPCDTLISLYEIWQACCESISQFKKGAIVSHKLFRRTYPCGPYGKQVMTAITFDRPLLPGQHKTDDKELRITAPGVAEVTARLS